MLARKCAAATAVSLGNAAQYVGLVLRSLIERRRVLKLGCTAHLVRLADNGAPA